MYEWRRLTDRGWDAGVANHPETPGSAECPEDTDRTLSARTGKSWQARTSHILKVLQSWWSGGKRQDNWRCCSEREFTCALGLVWGEKEWMRSLPGKNLWNSIYSLIHSTNIECLLWVRHRGSCTGFNHKEDINVLIDFPSVVAKVSWCSFSSLSRGWQVTNCIS